MIDTLKQKEYSQAFHDMRIRVMNSSPCSVKYDAPGDHWPYGTLYLYQGTDLQAVATLGDLTVVITLEEALILLSIAFSANDSPWFWW